MSQSHYAEDPEPSERVPAGLLSGSAGCTARFFRTPLGGRTAVGFTTEQQLTATLGASQPWIRLSESAVRALAAPLSSQVPNRFGCSDDDADHFTLPTPSRC